jgi:predicted nucleic acid-binding Zn finger protein
MQQLKIEHNNTTKKDRRPGKGRTIALSRHVCRLQNTDNTVYYVESETSDNQYYFVKFKPDVLEYSQCSCKDNSTRRGLKCKHLFAIEFAIKWGTIKEIDKLPTLETNKRFPELVVQESNNNKKSYLEDDYDF